MQSLVAPVATEPNLEVEDGPGLELAQVYGYEPARTEGGLKIKLDNMNQGLTQVVRALQSGPRGRTPRVSPSG